MKANIKIQFFSTDELPDVLTAKHISAHLHVSLRKAYELLQLSPEAGGIKSFSFDRSVRAWKKDYIFWLNNQQMG